MEQPASGELSPTASAAKRPKLETASVKGVGELYMYDMQADQRFKIGRTSGNDSSVRRKALQTANAGLLQAKKRWLDVPQISKFEADVHAELERRGQRVHVGGGTEFFTVPDPDATVALIDALLVKHQEYCALAADVDVAGQPSGAAVGVPVAPPDKAAALCDDYRRAKALERQAKAAADTAALKLKRELQLLGTTQFGWPGIPLEAQPQPMVHWNTVVTKRFDQTRFKKEHPDLAAKYTTPTETSRFTVHQ
jgi:hypothetical protein